MERILKYLRKCLHVLMGVMIFSSCHSDDLPQGGLTAQDTLLLFINCPVPPVQTRFGDPGSGTQEAADWNRLTLIVVYESTPAGGKPVETFHLDKDDFGQLADIDINNKTYKQYPLKLLIGKVYVYGLTYTTGVNGTTDLEAAIQACQSKADVEALTLANAYAEGDANRINKFLSVATGFYDNGAGQPALYDMCSTTTGLPTMSLKRLASKIDIQWDAQDSYANGYTDVRVAGFSFAATTHGHLFPQLNAGKALTAEMQDFHNTSAISQRNGRVYHYVFPDGATKPKVTFAISANGIAGNTYSMQFDNPLQQATWYKINTTIKGLTGTTAISIAN